MFIPKDTYHYLSPYCKTVYENYVLSFKADMVSKEQYEKIFTFPYIVNISDDIFALNFFSRLDHYNKILSLEEFKQKLFVQIVMVKVRLLKINVLLAMVKEELKLFQKLKLEFLQVLKMNKL